MVITELTIPVSVTVIGNYFIANRSITTVIFLGSEEKWSAIKKSASMWNYGNREVKLKFKTEPNILIVYFSATNNTERVAGYIADATGVLNFGITMRNRERWKSVSEMT